MGKAMYAPADMQAAIDTIRSNAEHYDLRPHHIAADLLENCRKNNDIEGMKFWRAVWIRIMSDEYLVSQKIPHRRRKHSQLPGEGSGR